MVIPCPLREREEGDDDHTISFIPREEERVTMPRSTLFENEGQMVAMALASPLQERGERVTMTVSSPFSKRRRR